MNSFWLLVITALFPAIVAGQINCGDEQIVSLELNMIAYHGFSHGAIVIDCEGADIQLKLTTYNSSYEVIESERHPIPSLSYKSFKAAVLPLEIKSMKELSNLYMIDAPDAEITFQDRYGNFNRFLTRVPAVRGRNLLLIETIIELAKALPISEGHMAYLNSLYNDFFIYCRP